MDKKHMNTMGHLYDLKWVKVGDAIQTNLKRAERFTFIDYSRQGLQQSQKGVSYIRMETMEENGNSQLPNLIDASNWVANLCTQFGEQAKSYILKVMVKEDLLPMKVIGVPPAIYTDMTDDLKDIKDTLFKKELTFYPSTRYGKYYRLEESSGKGGKGLEVEESMIEMLSYNNSYFRLDLSIKTFTVRYLESERKLLVRCFVNVPSLTWLQEKIPGVVVIASGKGTTKRTSETMDLLTKLRTSRKRKVEEVVEEKEK